MFYIIAILINVSPLHACTVYHTHGPHVQLQGQDACQCQKIAV